MNLVDEFVKTINELGTAKDEAVKRGEYDKAAMIRDRLDEVKLTKRQLLAKGKEEERDIETLENDYPNLRRAMCEGYISLAQALASAKKQRERDACTAPSTPPVELGSGGCTFATKDRGDCAHFVGVPGEYIPGMHDGPDDTVDEYGKPNGWCWSCWKSHQIEALGREVQALKAWQDVAAESNRDVSAYLQEKFPSLELDGGMPIGNVRKAIEHLETSELSGSEALYGFCGWLTTQDSVTTMSARHDAAPIATLVSTFCKKNNLSEPRGRWDKQLEHPPPLADDAPKKHINTSVWASSADLDFRDCNHGKAFTKAPTIHWETVSTRMYRRLASAALEKLSGDLSHDNVAAAKQILKKIVG